MKNPLIIAVDGPAGAGKSTIARLVARRLDILYLDTGAMYRAVGLKALRQNISPRSESEVAAMLRETRIDIRFADGEQQVWIDDQDVTADIRTPEVSLAASAISALPVVRLKLVEMQRQIAARQSLILDGRDIGSYVLPDAPYKFFLTAAVDERAQRRLDDLRARGDDAATLSEVKEDMIRRDEQDSQRALAPLRRADDAVLVDTTDLTIDEVVEVVLQRIGQDRDNG